MESLPPNAEFRIYPEIFHPWISTKITDTGPYYMQTSVRLEIIFNVTVTWVKVQNFQNPEIHVLNLVVCLQIIINFKLNGQLSKDEMKL